MKKRVLFWVGIAILIIIAISYFVPITLTKDAGNGVIAEIADSLLGIIIFHKLSVLIVYVLIAFVLIVLGVKKIRIKLH